MSAQWSELKAFPLELESFPQLGPEGERPGLYRVVLDKPVDRLRGQSPVLYVGSTSHLKGRLTRKHHVLPKLQELSAKLRGKNKLYLQLRALNQADIPLELGDGTWVRLLECAELNAYTADYDELPPLNGRSEGFIAGRAMLAISKGVAASKIGLAGELTATDEAMNALTYLPLLLKKGQKRDAQLPQLLWTWPEEWWEEAVPWWRNPQAFGRANRLLDPDTLYTFVPEGSPLTSYFGRHAQPYDFDAEGGLWWFQALTGKDWRKRGLTSDKLDELRSSILQPIEQFRKALQT
jgi:hypothetical protein